VYYRYSEKDFSIKNQKISDEEIEAINAALMVLLRFRGLPQFDWVNELIPKLQSIFHQDDTNEVISFDQNEFLTGIEHLPLLYKNIIKQNALKIEYQSFKETTSRILNIHPYYLKQYNKRWFLFGLNESDKFMYNLPLDRIKSITSASIKYIKNNETDFNEYFEDIVGVTLKPESKPIKIKLRLDKEITPYILTKPLHGSQKKIEQNNECTIIEVELIPNYELKQLLLSYSHNLLLSPHFL
jgi:predicted DNA-binding transcriptional regulator YafY